MHPVPYQPSFPCMFSHGFSHGRQFRFNASYSDQPSFPCMSSATGCGKTFTVLGSSNDEGIVPRSIRLVFHMVSIQARERDLRIRISVMEIYKESIQDLLLPMKERSSLSLREHPKFVFSFEKTLGSFK